MYKFLILLVLKFFKLNVPIQSKFESIMPEMLSLFTSASLHY